MYSCLLLIILVLIQNTFTLGDTSLTEIPEDTDISFRILFGSPTKIEEFPHYASLYNCGAAILSTRWVVTAAHCVVKPKDKTGFVWVGGERRDNSQKYEYDRCIIHPKYSESPVTVNDIALLRVTKPLQFSTKVSAIALPKPSSVNTQLRFVGRGRDEFGRNPSAISKVNYTRMTVDQCLSRVPTNHHNNVIPYLPTLAKAVICTKRTEDLPGICMGDSGGPLSDKDSLVGLASFVFNTKCERTRIGFFTNVANYLPWIKQYTGL